MLMDIKKSILAGIMISIGGAVYLSCIAKGYTWLGAILFSAGLYSICQLGFNLYTGKVCYIANQFSNGKYWGFVGLVLVFNLIASFLIGILLGKVYPQVREQALKIYLAKLEIPWWRSFVSSIFCGILIYLAVETWKQGSKIGVFLFIPTFILSGFDHSIANSFYNGAALCDSTFTMPNVIFVINVIIGNGIGGMLVPMMTRKWKDENIQKQEDVIE